MNRLIALIFFVLLMPILVFLYFILSISTSGRPIYKQKRVGRYEVPFTCYKFRTMKLGVAEVGTHLVSSGSVTMIGLILRKTKLDELPQLINVIKGEMHFVGPRPNLIGQSELIDERNKVGVYTLKPGITGLSQILKIDMSTPRLLARIDLLYKKNMSFCLDCTILVRTLIGYGQGDTARK